MKSQREAVLVIESDKITLAVIDKKYPNSFIHESSKEYSGYQEGEFLDELELRDKIKHLIIEAEGFLSSRISKVLVGVPGEFTTSVVRSTNMSLSRAKRIKPKLIKDLLEEAKPKDIAGYTVINAAPIDFILDSSRSTLKPEAMIAQNINATISYILCENGVYNLLENISHNLCLEFAYTSTILVESIYLLPDTLRDKGVWLVDVGFISTSVCYAKGDGIMFMLSFSLGGGYIAADIMEIMNIPYENAKSLSTKLNLNIDINTLEYYYITIENKNYKYEIQKVNEIATDRLIDLSKNIKAAMERFSASDKLKGSIETVYLTGSGISSISGVKEVLTIAFKKNVVITTSGFQMYNKPSQSALASFFALEKRKTNTGVWKKKIKKYLF